MKNYKLLYAVILAFVLSGCYDENLNTNHVQQDIQFFANIHPLNTRVMDNMWNDKDAIGIYMIRSGNPLNSICLSDNIKYIISNTAGQFVPTDTTKSIRFPYNGTNVDFIAYYPYKSSLSSFQYPIDLIDQSKQSAIDLMYSNNNKNLNNSSPTEVQLSFSHQLVKIVINIKALNDNYSLSNAKVNIKNVGLSANFSLVDKTISEPISTGTITFNTSDDGKTSQAILLPEKDLSNKELQILVGDDSFNFNLKSLQKITSFERGKRYTFNVTINPQLGNLVSISNASISNWIDEEAIDIKINESSPSSDNETIPPTQKGTEQNPYTIAETEKNYGKTDVWIKGYIVGYYTGTTSSSFEATNENVTKDTNIAIADNPNEKDVSKTFAISLNPDKYREDLNLKSNPDNFGKILIIKGDIVDNFRLNGIKYIKGFQLK